MFQELYCQKLLQGRAKGPAPPASDEASEDEDEDADEDFSREQRRARKHPERFTRDQLEALNLLPSASERISVAWPCKAAAKAVRKVGQLSPEGAIAKAINALMDAIVTDEDDGADFDEHARSRIVASKVTVEQATVWGGSLAPFAEVLASAEAPNLLLLWQGKFTSPESPGARDAERAGVARY